MNHFQITVFSLVIVLLLSLGAFFSCTETALMAVNRYRLRHEARLKKRYAARILQLLKRPDRLLGVILIGNTFANMMASSLVTLLALNFWSEKGAIWAAVGFTIATLIFSEIAPKTLAATYPDKVARWVVYPIQTILRLLYPIVWLVSTVTNGLLRLLRVRVANFPTDTLSREELRSMVLHDTVGKIPRQYQTMLLGILDLSHLGVDDVMIPQHEIVGIDLEQPIDVIIEQIKQFPQEWVPVYRGHINQVIGVLRIRDVLRALLMQTSISKDALQQLLLEPYFVPEGTSLSVQLADFQLSRDKLAFVVDEYGEMQGMLTLNNILEEIVGDFTSSIKQGKRVTKQIDGSFLVDGAITVREFNRLTEWDLPLHGARTVNGLLIEYLQALPHVGTAVLITGYPIEIVQVKENRVKLARVFPKLKEII